MIATIMPYATIIYGGILGFLYGYFFLQKKQLVFSSTRNNSFNRLYIFISPFVRIAFIAILLYLLLPSPMIHSILTIAAFMGGFWYIILSKGHSTNGQSRTHK